MLLAKRYTYTNYINTIKFRTIFMTCVFNNVKVGFSFRLPFWLEILILTFLFSCYLFALPFLLLAQIWIINTVNHVIYDDLYLFVRMRLANYWNIYILDMIDCYPLQRTVTWHLFCLKMMLEMYNNKYSYPKSVFMPLQFVTHNKYNVYSYMLCYGVRIVLDKGTKINALCVTDQMEKVTTSKCAPRAHI